MLSKKGSNSKVNEKNMQHTGRTDAAINSKERATVNSSTKNCQRKVPAEKVKKSCCSKVKENIKDEIDVS